MESNIIARSSEKAVLNRLYTSPNPEFLAVYGRRRVGKSFLITEYFEDKGVFFEIIGDKGASDEVELTRFASELSYKFYQGKTKFQINDWETAFSQLVTAIDQKLTEGGFKSKITLFFDELPWLGSGHGGQKHLVLSTLGYYWNKYFSKPKYSRVLLIICGSAASWVINNVINNKAGLHNRVTEVIKLQPFTLSEARLYLKSRGIKLEQKQLVDLYMAIGGVPAYLSKVNGGCSAADNIGRLCFEKGGYLSEEFNRLFSSLFENSHNHITVIRALASKAKGMTRQGIINATGLNTGRVTTILLKELEEAGFIFKVPAWGNKKKGAIYKLGDEYTLFYLKWIEPARSLNSAGSLKNYWSQKSTSPSWYAWAGYAFEGICLKHADKIKNGLNVLGVLSRQSGWAHTGSPQAKGAQIDLLIDRADRTINLCEIKYRDGVYELTEETKNNLEYKKQLFRDVSKTRSLIVVTMITPYGVKETPRYFEVVAKQLTLECLLEA